MWTILQVGAFPFPLHQGSQVYVRGLSEALARRGHRVVVACWAGGRGEVRGVRVVRARGVPGAVERSGPHWSRLPQDLALVAAVRRILREERVDVVHAHNVEAPVVARLAGTRVPLVYGRHTAMEEELPAFLPGSRLLGRAVDALAPRISDATAALSARGARSVPGRVAVLPPGVDPEEVTGGDGARARARWGLGEGPWVLYTGNTDPYQDLPVLLAAMARVPAGLLLLTGDDPGPLEAEADRLGIRHRMVRTRALSDLRDALAAATVGALPRARCAGFPIKLLNHLAAGLPTVAAAGSARAIPGVLAVPAGEPEAMAGALRALLKDPPRRERLAGQARRAVAEEWTWDARAAEVEAFYASLVEPR